MPALRPSSVSAWSRRLSVWLDHLAPRSCAVCGLLLPPGAHTGLCTGCLLSLPGSRRARCARCALPRTRPHAPCPGCPQPTTWLDQTLAVADYAPPLDRALTALKFGRQLALARPLGALLAACWRGSTTLPELDCLIPIPLSDARLAQRGFNQALALAQGMNAALARPLPIRRRTLCRTRDTPAQTSLGLPDRQLNLGDALSCRQGLTGLRIGLIDDVMTSGSTLNEAARTLKTAGAAHVIALVVARTA